MEDELSLIPGEEKLILGGDLNGHVGRDRTVIERVHGGWGLGERNQEGERVVDLALSFDLAICNTFFKKKVSQYMTYKSGGRESQIDLLMSRRIDLKGIRNCKVINTT